MHSDHKESITCIIEIWREENSSVIGKEESEESVREEKFFNFCKTAHKPYDKYVVEVLSLAEMRFGDLIEISSDGDWEKIKVHCERQKA